jgi:hypothetical protein
LVTGCFRVDIVEGEEDVDSWHLSGDYDRVEAFENWIPILFDSKWDSN